MLGVCGGLWFQAVDKWNDSERKISKLEEATKGCYESVVTL